VSGLSDRVSEKVKKGDYVEGMVGIPGEDILEGGSILDLGEDKHRMLEEVVAVDSKLVVEGEVEGNFLCPFVRAEALEY
jgi:hypothetical protein